MVNNLYDFWKKDLADVYLEAIKPVMRSDDVNKKAAALNTLYICLDAALRMLHRGQLEQAPLPGVVPAGCRTAAMNPASSLLNGYSLPALSVYLLNGIYLVQTLVCLPVS